MVCDRCKSAVKGELEKLGLKPVSVELGEVELDEMPTPEQMDQIGSAVVEIGFELLDDRKSKIVEKIKNVIVDMVHYKKEPLVVKQSEYISSHVGLDYHYLSKIFPEVEGVTIEQFVINQKVERVKELLTYGELSLNEIADILGYSSVQHLSQQFKTVTGLTATAFKKLNQNTRKPLDKI